MNIHLLKPLEISVQSQYLVINSQRCSSNVSHFEYISLLESDLWLTYLVCRT